jgi:cyclophilin family peptidyl-prolyl cis-trans isomerase
MRSKFVVAALGALFLAGTAFAQALPVAEAPPSDPQNILNLDLSTGGRVQILLRPDKAPYSVDRIKTLVRRHFYDGLIFHRVIEGFMAQGGDPKGTGEGGSDLPDVKAEFNDLPHVRGTMAMARAESPDSANSQFYIMLQPNLTLDGNYTPIGRVVTGMQFVDAIEKGEPPANPSKIVHASIQSDDLGQAPAAFVPPPPDAKKAEVGSVTTATFSDVDEKAVKQQKKQAAKDAKKAAKESKKAEKESAEADRKAKRAEPPAPPVQEVAPASPPASNNPAPAEEPSAPPSGTDAAVNAVSDGGTTDAAVETMTSGEAATPPQ